MDSKAVLLMLVLGVLLIAPYALAVDPAGGQVQGTPTENGPYTETSAGSINVKAGSIYLTNVTGEQSTYHWVGVYGNATGKLVLGYGSNKMYEWTANANYVLFSNTTDSPDWTTLSYATCGNFPSYVDSTSSASDKCDNTFNESTIGVSFKSLPAPTGANPVLYALTFDNSGTRTWKTYALLDGSSNLIFAAEANPSGGTAFDGSTVNYQAILPEDGENGNANPTVYNIWIELY